MAQKAKLALYWAASCGGCEIAVVRLYAKILDVAETFDIVLWPCIMDFKYKDVEALPDKSIDLCLFNGAIRNSEQEYMAHLLREKSKVLVAFGACAHTGGIPGLANVADRESIFQCVYDETFSTVNANGVRPQLSYQVPEGWLTLPEFYDTVRTLAQVVPVEYFVPGCPPVKEQVEAVIQAVAEGNLPAPGSVVGASDKTVCDDCTRIKEDKRIRSIYRPWEVIPDSRRCLLEQGVVCAGPATRGGCGGPCPSVSMPCRGCYGPPPNVVDQGGKLLSAIASIIDTQDPAEFERVADAIPDLLGTCYLFGLPSSLLFRVRQERGALPAKQAVEQ